VPVSGRKPTGEIRAVLQGGLPLFMAGDTPLHDVIGRNPFFSAVKRALDIAVAAFLLILFAPLLLMAAAAIKVSAPGPVFQVDEREGLKRRRFKLVRFRTTPASAGGHPQGSSCEAQITPLGRFLRSTGLDELPQLFNVLIGDMSMVGPRAYAPGMRVGARSYDELVPYYHLRHEVRPGLAGWAQVNGFRGHTKVGFGALESIHYDIAYVQNASLALDVKIIWRTFAREFMAGYGS